MVKHPFVDSRETRVVLTSAFHRKRKPHVYQRRWKKPLASSDRALGSAIQPQCAIRRIKPFYSNVAEAISRSEEYHSTRVPGRRFNKIYNFFYICRFRAAEPG